MDDCVGSLRLANGQLQKPVAYLTCNFNGPVGGKPALFTHNEVTTLFHEFGHGLHHMLTKIDTAGVSGINGVPWDAVELPSQFMETGAGSRRRWPLFLVITKLMSLCRKRCWINYWRRKTIRRRCLFCANWSLVCSISGCIMSSTR